MNVFIVLTAIFAVAQALPLSEIEEKWQNFKVNYGKSYETEEEENLRKEIFSKNLHKHEEHNQKFKDGLISYTVGVTKFADMSLEEFELMLTPMDVSAMKDGDFYNPPDNEEVPSSIDWREKGAVTPVKDQEFCGSCYAFSANGALEGQLFLKTGKLVSLSEQNLVDCSSTHGNNGCHGGLPSNCYTYIQDNGGINTEESYPYEGKVGQCRYKPENFAGTDHSYVRIQPKNETLLQMAVGLVGPISIGINGGSFHSYDGGIIEGDCDPEKLNHGVVIVGYGTEDGKDFWIIKNSWGPSWGEDGYVRMIRHKNQCGLTSMATFPVV